MAVTPVVWAPACFDAPELEQWRTGEVAACADCTPSWHTTSRAAGRCNGVPGFLTRDLGVEEDEPMETPATYTSSGDPVATRARIAVVAPCKSCVHARVCRLRPGDELTVSVQLPALDAALDLTLTATVECAEYVRAKGGAKPVVTAGHPHTAETKAKLRAKALERAAARAEAAS